MKTLTRILFGAFIISFLLIPSRSSALYPIDQECNTGVAGSNIYQFIGTRDGYQVFVPEKKMLDAVAVRVRTEIGESSRIKMEVLDVTRDPIRTLASMTLEVDRTEKWLLYDFEDVATPLGMYVIKLRNADDTAHAIWKGRRGECYARGYAIDGETPDLDLDYGFATYGYDPAPAVAEPAPNDPGDPALDDSGTADDGTSGDQNTSSGDQGSSGVSTTDASPPNSSSSSGGKVTSKASASASPMTKEQAEKIARELQSQSDDSSPFDGILFFLAMAAVPIILIVLLFFIGVGGLLLLIFYKRKKKATNAPAAPQNPPTQLEAVPAPPKIEQKIEPKELPQENKPKSKKSPIFIVLLIIIIALILLGGGGFAAYKIYKGIASRSASQTAATPTPAVVVSPSSAEENEFGPIIKSIDSAATLKSKTAIAGGEHILYVPSRKFARADFDKIKSELEKKGYANYEDKKFKGEKSVTLTKDDKFIVIPFAENHISITVVGKVNGEPPIY